MQADITNLNKADGIYLSYPTLWLTIPYLIFKILWIPISNFNLGTVLFFVQHFLSPYIA